MGGASTRTVPVQEVTIAVAPEEVAPLAEALGPEVRAHMRSAGEPRATAAPAQRSPAENTRSRVPQSVAKLEPGGPDVARSTTVSAKVSPPEKAAPPSAVRKKDLTPGFDPYQQVRGIQLIVGDHRQNVYVTEPGGNPVITDADGGTSEPASKGTAESKP